MTKLNKNYSGLMFHIEKRCPLFYLLNKQGSLFMPNSNVIGVPNLKFSEEHMDISALKLRNLAAAFTG